jgi:hypothetical protein
MILALEKNMGCLFQKTKSFIIEAYLCIENFEGFSQ